MHGRTRQASRDGRIKSGHDEHNALVMRGLDPRIPGHR